MLGKYTWTGPEVLRVRESRLRKVPAVVRYNAPRILVAPSCQSTLPARVITPPEVTVPRPLQAPPTTLQPASSDSTVLPDSAIFV